MIILCLIASLSTAASYCMFHIIPKYSAIFLHTKDKTNFLYFHWHFNKIQPLNPIHSYISIFSLLSLKVHTYIIIFFFIITWKKKQDKIFTWELSSNYTLTFQHMNQSSRVLSQTSPFWSCKCTLYFCNV